jgi:hypothetical protein
MLSTQELEQWVIETLSADAQPIHPRLNEALEKDSVRPLGIALNGYLGIFGQPTTSSNSIDNGCDMVGGPEARRTPAKVKTHRRRPGTDLAYPGLQFGENAIAIRLLRHIANHRHIEVAIRAVIHTIRVMNVYPKAHTGFGAPRKCSGVAYTNR